MKPKTLIDLKNLPLWEERDLNKDHVGKIYQLRCNCITDQIISLVRNFTTKGKLIYVECISLTKGNPFEIEFKARLVGWSIKIEGCAKNCKDCGKPFMGLGESDNSCPHCNSNSILKEKNMKSKNPFPQTKENMLNLKKSLEIDKKSGMDVDSDLKEVNRMLNNKK